MADEARLQISEFTHLSYGSLTCTVRCLAGVVRVGDRVRLRSAASGSMAGGLTVSQIWRYGDVPFIDLGMTARVTVTSAPAIEVAAIKRAAEGTPAGQWHRLGFQLVADPGAL
ncbi:hypothetical protein [Paractinoplanes brasiliensis]|uniref:PilZ domain-containing protein n=1 Tax=Paractinoplanes brasiliensis TaxID=52695 RepID=A0A4R6J768_9ACTN|nr:hypothetical protein [Actinoplanes brasiliensis]TDO31340.1 hypothetical protein C8E87_6759 [Actinoplanes brasiliensis]GID28330.1 hypothetical protein Abr02nite_33130 [Actinoplanes brasiliensis]